MTLSVMITTKNRLVDLRRTCRALQQLDPPPVEVLITMDGCTDEIVEAVKAELPHAIASKAVKPKDSMRLGTANTSHAE